MAAQEEGWGEEFRAVQDRLRQLEEEEEAWRRQQSRKRQREEDHRAKLNAKEEEERQMEKERIALYRNDHRELKRNAEWQKAMEAFTDRFFSKPAETASRP